MKINWVNGEIKDFLEVQSLIKIENNFRAAITKKWLSSIDDEFVDQLNVLDFNFCVKQKKFEISEKTPKFLHSHICTIMLQEA